jgi:hypothetical protein
MNVFEQMIKELVDEDKTVITKMSKKQLVQYGLSLQADLYRELPNESIVEMYQEQFNCIVKGI